MLKLTAVGSGAMPVFEISPSDSRSFKIRAIFLTDVRGEPRWGIVYSDDRSEMTSATPTSEPKIASGNYRFVKPSTSEVNSTFDLPPSLKQWKVVARCVGKPLDLVAYGTVPVGFAQIFPLNGSPPAPLDVGQTYRLFVLGSESGAVDYIALDGATHK